MDELLKKAMANDVVGFKDDLKGKLKAEFDVKKQALNQEIGDSFVQAEPEGE